MAVSRNGGQNSTRRRRRKKRTAELSAQLAPLEELEASKSGQPQPDGDGNHAPDDTIRVDSASLKLPEKLTEDEREGAAIFRVEPVVVAILIVMLAFIAFVAWQITLMPAAR